MLEENLTALLVPDANRIKAEGARALRDRGLRHGDGAFRADLLRRSGGPAIREQHDGGGSLPHLLGRLANHVLDRGQPPSIGNPFGRHRQTLPIKRSHGSTLGLGTSENDESDVILFVGQRRNESLDHLLGLRVAVLLIERTRCVHDHHEILNGEPLAFFGLNGLDGNRVEGLLMMRTASHNQEECGEEAHKQREG